MAEYNLLTQALLAAGYTVDNFPTDKVKLPGGCYGKSPLENIYGGFEYVHRYSDNFVYKTGCGLYVKGRNVIGNMSTAGIDWCHENDNPVIRCPYDKPDCPQNDPKLYGTQGGGLCIQCWCVCHRTKDDYNYNASVEKKNDERLEEGKRKYKELVEKRHGRVCRNHAYYNERAREWHINYKPERCTHWCERNYGFCPILGKELDKKKGNVYYDLKKSGRRREGEQLSLFDGEQWATITKGLKVFGKPVSLDICRAYIKVQRDEILEKWEMNNAFYRLIDKSLKAEVLNVRAARTEARDLMQDLQDIQNGITVYHESDLQKSKQTRKKELRQQAQEKKIERLERKLIAFGYENLQTVDQMQADKWLKPERLEELEEIRRKRAVEEKNQLVQMSMADFMK